jgi:lysophospholipase L1-like esterase
MKSALHHLLLAATSVLLSACAVLSGPEPPTRVLLLGDSISIGYHAAVVEALGPEFTVVRPMANPEKGRAENCEGTTKGVKAIERWLALEGGDWDIVHFNFGLHDLKRVDAKTRKNSNDPADSNQADLATYGQQLAVITDALLESGADLIFATTTPVPEGGVRPHRDPEDVPRYNDAARALMQERGIAIDDLYAFALPRLEEIQEPVNVHFTAEGSKALGEEVARVIRGAARR